MHRSIRIQPQEVKICINDPFRHDLLDREETAKALTNLVGNIDGPCVMAVDAAWGAGKTTFLKMWARYLRKERFPVVEFNAWETDSSGDPFVALTSEITEQLKVWNDGTIGSMLNQIERDAKDLLIRLGPRLIRLGAGSIPILGTELGNILGAYADEVLTGYLQSNQSAARYRSSLQALANSLREASNQKPIVVLIDELVPFPLEYVLYRIPVSPARHSRASGNPELEVTFRYRQDHLETVLVPFPLEYVLYRIPVSPARHSRASGNPELEVTFRYRQDHLETVLDRCRPSYAIELLETSKHIFGVDHVVFVLAVNRAELAHSVKALYGIEFDAEGYLRRFFDFDFRLPSTDRRAFIRNMLSSIGVEEFIASNSDRFASGHSELVSETLVQFLGKSNLGLRSVEQAIHRLRAVLFSLGKNDCVNLKVLTVLTVLSAVEPALYRRFVEGEASAEETIGPFFSQINFAELRRTSSGVLVESVIIASKISRSSACLTAEDMQKEAPLLSGYKQIIEDSEAGRTVHQTELHRARGIHDSVLRLHDLLGTANESLRWEESVQRFEVL